MANGTAGVRSGEDSQASGRSHRIPLGDDVLEEVLATLRKGRADSQRELRSRVLEALPKGFALSPQRTRRIASQSDLVRIRVFTRRAERPLQRCPFCGHLLIETEMRDLMGKATRAGRECPKCGFKMDPGKRMPRRYVFELR